MKFHMLYWVTEEVDGNGAAEVTGVYTSIPDLIDNGLRVLHQSNGVRAFRVTLVKLDSAGPPLGRWTSPGFDGLSEVLDGLVRSHDFTAEQADDLRRHLAVFGKSVAADPLGVRAS